MAKSAVDGCEDSIPSRAIFPIREVWFAGSGYQVDDELNSEQSRSVPRRAGSA